MKFKINNQTFEIREVSQEEIKQKEQEYYERKMASQPSECGRYFGITYHDEQLILIDKDLPIERKRKTLIHELTHTYIGCYITHEDHQYDEELVCDISSNAHDIIEEVLKNYFK